jgi:Na+-translocating ferredoxin:NAD+ oxidoreductase RnfE subunit
MVFDFFDINAVLVWPSIITSLIAPYFFVSIALGLALNKMNIFRPAINFPLAFIIMGVSIPLIVKVSFIVGRAALFSIGPIKSWSIKGVILGIGLMGIYHFLMPIIMGFLGA